MTGWRYRLGQHVDALLQAPQRLLQLNARCPTRRKRTTLNMPWVSRPRNPPATLNHGTFEAESSSTARGDTATGVVLMPVCSGSAKGRGGTLKPAAAAARSKSAIMIEYKDLIASHGTEPQVISTAPPRKFPPLQIAAVMIVFHHETAMSRKLSFDCLIHFVFASNHVFIESQTQRRLAGMRF